MDIGVWRSLGNRAGPMPGALHKLILLIPLMEIAEHGENESARVAAATAVLDRGWR